MEKQTKNDPKLKKGRPFRGNQIALVFLMTIVFMAGYLFMTKYTNPVQEWDYSDFLQSLENGDIKSVTIIEDKDINYELITPENETVQATTKIPYTDDKLLPLLKEKGVVISSEEKPVAFIEVLIGLLPWIFIFGFIIFMSRNLQGNGPGKAMSFGKSKAKQYSDEDKKIMFADVAGQDEAKNELEEVVDYLKNKDKYIKLGAKIPKGVLLVGPPGTGKTLLAKAVAGEAKVPFFHMSGSDFVEMFVGVGASRVRDLFDQGKKSAPCIIFIDELDAVGRKRGAGYGGGHDEREQTLNQMLVEMDGFGSQEGIIMLAATNRPDVLDPALLRPGRFDRQVVVDMPDVKEREAILKIHSKKIVLDEDVDLNTIAKATPGCSGADIANLVNEAALLTARADKKSVGMYYFEEARDKLLMGTARISKVITDDEKLATAYHEAGHALLHFLLDNVDKLHKVSIIPRGRALGVTFSLPEKDVHTYNKSSLLDRIKVFMGGYVAEKLIYNETTTGTSNDIERATDIASQMVCKYGMSSLGFVSFGSEGEPVFIGKELTSQKNFSDNTASLIDQEIHAIIDSCMKNTTQLLTDNIDKLELLTRTLVEKETMDYLEVKELLGY